VAIVNGGGHGSLPFSCLERGRGYVVAPRGETVVVEVYFSPNRGRAELEAYLAEVEAAIRRHLPRPVLVTGDLNAKSGACGFPVTNAKGVTVKEWVEGLYLVVLNKGCVPTCVRDRGDR
jgi:hypothetical protein